jgi:hypothetical protein
MERAAFPRDDIREVDGRAIPFLLAGVAFDNGRQIAAEPLEMAKGALPAWIGAFVSAVEPGFFALPGVALDRSHLQSVLSSNRR